jgi:hypothetical protein
MGPKFLVNVGFDGESKGEKQQRYISPHGPDPSHPIVTNVDKISGMDEVIKHIKYGVHLLISAGFVGS